MFLLSSGVTRNLLSAIERADTSKFPSHHKEDNEDKPFEFDGTSTTQEQVKDGSEFDSDGGRKPRFNRGGSQFNPINFFKSSHWKHHIHRAAKSGKKFISSKLSKIGSFFQNDEAVKAKHEVRVNALGDTCQPECDADDSQCNCEDLLDCVDSMDEYDLMVLVAGGKY